MNLYGYCQNSPLNAADAYGACLTGWQMIGIGTASGLAMAAGGAPLLILGLGAWGGFMFGQFNEAMGTGPAAPLGDVLGGVGAAAAGTGAGGFLRGVLTLPKGELLDEALAVAQDPDFIAKAKGLGFSDEEIASLPDRLRAYGSNISWRLEGGNATEDAFEVGTRSPLGSTPQERIAHELGHVLDDIRQPGLFERSTQPGFGFSNFYNAERVAYTMQYGYNPLPLTAFNAGMQSNPAATVAVTGGIVWGGVRWYA